MATATDNSLFYYPMTLNRGSITVPVTAPFVQNLPPISGVVEGLYVRTQTQGGVLDAQGVFVWDSTDERFRFALPYTEVCHAIIGGASVNIYYDITQAGPVIPTGATVYRNGLPYAGTSFTVGDNAVWAVLVYPISAAGDVKSVNSQSPDQSGNVLLKAVSTAGQGQSIVALDGSVNGQFTFKTINGGTGITVTSDANTVTITGANTYVLPVASATVLGGVKVGSGLSIDGSGVLTAAGAVSSVSGQTGAVVVQASDNNAASGTSLISNSGSTTGNIKLKTLVAGANIILSADANGNIQINAAGGGSVTAVQSVGAGTSLINNDGTTGGIAKIKSLTAGSNITITNNAQSDTLTITANQVLSPATTTTIGGVIVKAGLNVDGSGNLSLAAPTGVNLGGVKAGSNITIDADGTISSTLAATVTSFATGTSGQLHGDIVFAAGQAISLSNTGNTIQINGTGVPDAPNDGNLYGRQNLGWTLIPSTSNPIVAVNGQTGTGAVILVEASPPANTAVIKSLVAGQNVTLTESNGLITVTASIPGGTVATVNSIAPDGTGNVTLTAASVNALPTAGGTMSGTINMASNKITNLPSPSASGDAVPQSYISGLVIDGGTYA